MSKKRWKKVTDAVNDVWWEKISWREGFWEKLQKNHPLAYEVTQWTILAISVLAVIINIIKIT